jgi:hypothetical protein
MQEPFCLQRLEKSHPKEYPGKLPGSFEQKPTDFDGL